MLRTAMRFGFGFALAVTLAGVSGCSSSSDGGSGGGGNGGNGGGDPGATNGAGGGASNATSVTCGTMKDCAYWYCRCADGAVVNSADCSNGYCSSASVACPKACTAFQHGSWSGEATGGPSKTDRAGSDGGGGGGGGTCSRSQDCASIACTCADDSVVNTQSCTNGTCDPASIACVDACSGNGGVR